MPTSVKASYIIPYRSQNKWREDNLLALVKTLKPHQGLEIIVVEEGDSPKGENALKGLEIIYKFLPSSDAFNKSRAMNFGARVASSDILIFGDADMFVASEVLSESISACNELADAINPYQFLYEMSEAESSRFLTSNEMPNANNIVSGREAEGEKLCFSGGLFLIKKSVFDELEGMDERFIGWGGEDDAFSLKLIMNNIETLERTNGFGFHLYHPRELADRYHHPNYEKNVALLNTYRSELARQLQKS